MPEIQTQLSELARYLDAEFPNIELDEILAANTDDHPVRPVRERRPVPGWAYGLVAAVLVLLLVGVIPLVLRRDATPPADSVVPTTLAESAPTTLTEPTPTTLPEDPPETFVSPLTLKLSVVRHEEALFGDGWPGSVAVGEAGLVSVGSSGLPDSDVVVWTSPDGVSWIRAETDESTFGEAHVSSVAPLADGFVLVGSDDSGGDADAAVWTSPDGIAWTRVAHDETVFGGGGDQIMVSVTSFGGGVVAVGESSTLAAVWFSSDGSDWSRIQSDPPTFDNAIALSVTPFDGGIAVVGFDGSGGDADAAVWTSPDGIAWTRVAHDETVLGGDGDQMMLSVVAFDDGLVAVGFDQVPFGDAAVWTSKDGIVWTRVPHDEAIFGGEEGGRAEMTSIVTFDESLVGVGWIESQAPNSVAATWTSSDGTTWSRLTDGDLFPDDDHVRRITSVAKFDGLLVAVGFQAVTSPGQRLDSDPDAVVWILTP